jgi:hypothetical protein
MEKNSAPPRSMPTLGDVGAALRFQPLQQLLRPVAESPVDALGSELRAGLLDDATVAGSTRLMQAFFGECDAAKERAMRELERKMAAVTLAPSGACLGASL